MRGWLGRHRRLTVLGLVLVVAFAADASRSPGQQWTTGVAVATILGYQHAVAPRLAAAGVKCRFTPTCSHYAEEVLRRHGILGGTWRAAVRVARCGPWTPMGTVDPPR